MKNTNIVQDVSSIKLTQVEEHYKFMAMSVQQSSEGMAYADLDGNLIFINKAWYEMHGYKSDKDLLGKNLAIFHNKKQMIDEVIPFNKIVMKNGSNNGKVGHITKDGKVFPTLMTVNLLKDANGNPFALAGIAKDITQQKKIENKLRQDEQQLKLIYDSTAEILYFLKIEKGPKYRFISVNKPFLEATGLTKDQVLGKTISDVIPKPALELVLSNYKKAISEKRIVDWEETSQYPAGLKTGVVSIAPVYDDKGNCTHLVGSVHDITERKQTEQELRDSEYLLRESQRVANIGSYVLDISSGIWESSNILEDIYGINKKYKKDVAGWLQIVHPDDKDMMQDYFATNVLTNKEFFNKEYRIKRINDQQECWVHGMGKLVLNDEGEPIKMIGTIQDITKRKQAEEKLISRNKELEVWYDVSVNRELNLIDLKKEINELLKKYGEKPKYKIPV